MDHIIFNNVICNNWLFIAIFLSLSKMYGNKVLYTISNCYIEIIRGTPLLVQLFILYYSLPVIGIRLSPLTASIISFS